MTDIQITNIKFEVNINEALRRYKSTNIIDTKKKLEKLEKLTDYSVNDINDETYKLLKILKEKMIISFNEIDVIAEMIRIEKEIQVQKSKEAKDWFDSLNDVEKEMVYTLIKDSK